MRTKPSTDAPKHGRLIVGITGASGVVYGIRALEMLAQSGIESHLVMSKAAEMTIRYETVLCSDCVLEALGRGY